MQYEIALARVQREIAVSSSHASITYKFRISHHSSTAYADVRIPEGGVSAIVQSGKDPETAARIALERLLKDGRDPFAGFIRVTVPFGHAVHFARFGNYESLPILTG